MSLPLIHNHKGYSSLLPCLSITSHFNSKKPNFPPSSIHLLLIPLYMYSDFSIVSLYTNGNNFINKSIVHFYVQFTFNLMLQIPLIPKLLKIAMYSLTLFSEVISYIFISQITLSYLHFILGFPNLPEIFKIYTLRFIPSALKLYGF